MGVHKKHQCPNQLSILRGVCQCLHINSWISSPSVWLGTSIQSFQIFPIASQHNFIENGKNLQVFVKLLIPKRNVSYQVPSFQIRMLYPSRFRSSRAHYLLRIDRQHIKPKSKAYLRPLWCRGLDQYCFQALPGNLSMWTY